MNVKAELVFRYAPEMVKTREIPEPDHPPVSEKDPDYADYYENKEVRFREAVMIPPEEFRMHLHVYNIAIMQGELAVAWIEVYVESDHDYLSFKVIHLEFEEHYRIDRVISDIVGYFGASEEDRREGNERYLRLVRYQKK